MWVKLAQRPALFSQVRSVQNHETDEDKILCKELGGVICPCRKLQGKQRRSVRPDLTDL